MRIEKNRILVCDKKAVLVIDYLFYLGENYVLTIEVDTERKITNNVIIYQEHHHDNELLLKRVRDKHILKYICPMFAKNVQRNLI